MQPRPPENGQKNFRNRNELAEPLNLPEGATVLVTPLVEEDASFWAGVSNIALDPIWENAEEDVYAQLL